MPTILITLRPGAPWGTLTHNGEEYRVRPGSGLRVDGTVRGVRESLTASGLSCTARRVRDYRAPPEAQTEPLVDPSHEVNPLRGVSDGDLFDLAGTFDRVSTFALWASDFGITWKGRATRATVARAWAVKAERDPEAFAGLLSALRQRELHELAATLEASRPGEE